MNLLKKIKKLRFVNQDKIDSQINKQVDDRIQSIIQSRVGFSDDASKALTSIFTDESFYNLINEQPNIKKEEFNKFFEDKKIQNQQVKDLIFNSLDNVPEVDLVNEELFLMQDACWVKYGLDPIITGVVENYINYVLGGGLTIETPVSEVNQVILEFRKLNKMANRERSMVKHLIIDGEFFCLLFSDRKGNVFVRKAHPRTIVSIETSPNDIEVPYSYEQNFGKYDNKGQTESNISLRHIKDIDYDKLSKFSDIFPKSTFNNLIQNAVVKHIKFNDPDKLRGLPPMRNILRWSKLFENFLLDRAILNHERAKVVWIKKYSQQVKDDLNLSSAAPRGGITLIEKDGITYRTESSKLDSSEAKEDGLNILYYIGTGILFPIHILNQRTDQQVYASHNLQSTNFLTNNGWKNLDDIDKDEDLAATINPTTQELEWQPINGITKYWYEGDMYSFENKSTCAEVTPNHDMYLAKRGSSKHNKVLKDEVHISHFKKVEADKAFSNYSWWSLCKIDWPEMTPILNTDAKMPSFMESNIEDWLKILGFYIGDGSINFRGYVVGDNFDESVSGTIRIHCVRQRKIDYLIPIAKRLNWDIFYSIDGDVYFNYSNKEVAHWLKNNAGHGSYNKQLPLFVFNLPKKLLNYVFDGLLNSDGNIDSRIGRTIMTYSTRSLQLAEDVMMITLKLGYRSKIIYQDMPETREIKGRLIIDGERKYHVKFFPSDKYELMSKQRECIKLITDFKGYVGCINVDNGLIVTRCNGKIAIHGNSIRKADAPFQKMIESSQLFYAEEFESIYRHLIKEKVKAKELEEKYTYKAYAEDSIILALNTINDGVLSRKPISEIKLEVGKLLEDGESEITVKTIDIPISLDFPQMLWQDPKEMAEVLKIHNEIGIASKSTLSSKAGYKWKKELPKILSEFQLATEQQKILTPESTKGKQTKESKTE